MFLFLFIVFYAYINVWRVLIMLDTYKNPNCFMKLMDLSPTYKPHIEYWDLDYFIKSPDISFFENYNNSQFKTSLENYTIESNKIYSICVLCWLVYLFFYVKDRVF